MLIPVILAGGSGDRLWPLSRSAYPKQFLPLISDKSMLQETILRVQKIQDVSAPWVIFHKDYLFFFS